MFKSPTYRFLAGDFNNDLGADSNSGPVLGPGVYLNNTPAKKTAILPP